MKQERVKRIVERDLRRAATPEDAAAVVAAVLEKAEARVEVQKEGRVPGKIINGQKVPYTRKDLDEIYGICAFTPEETIPITIQGVRFQCVAGMEMLCPTEVKVVYDRTMRTRRQMPKLPNNGYTNEVTINAGPLPQ